MSFLKRVPKLGLFKLFPRKNWRIILMCVTGATTFWFFNSLNKNYTTSIEYPIKFEYEREGLIEIGNMPTSLKVDVTGVGWNLLRRSIGFKSNALLIPLERPTQTKFILGQSLRPLITKELGELEVNYVISDSLFLSIDKRISKKVPLFLDSSALSLEKNYKITSSISIEPDSVLIIGPKSTVDTLTSFIEVVIDEKDIDAQFENDIDLISPSQFVALTPNEVVVTFDVDEYVEQKMAIKYHNLHNFDYQSISDSILDINFVIREKDIEQLNDSLFVANLNFENFQLSDSTISPLLFTYPNFILDVAIDSSRIKLIPE